eukprot:11654766-Alexandrium_andersonii.AAC.1
MSRLHRGLADRVVLVGVLALTTLRGADSGASWPHKTPQVLSAAPQTRPAISVVQQLHDKAAGRFE